jgi:acyl-CoA synthetase (AMP-forming)/AMP-acid ligase II
MFWENFEKYKERPALFVTDNYVTYKELNQLCELFANQLPKEKKLVLLDADNSLESIVALYGALKKGHGVLLCERGNAVLKQKLCERFKPELIFEKRGSSWELSQRKHNYSPALHKDLAFLLTTSGSTGDPKCVRLSKTNILSNTDAISSYLSISETDRSLLLLPIFYCFGLSVLNTHLSKGACVYIQGPSVDDTTFFRYLTEKKITNFSGVPHTFELLARKGFLKKHLSSVRYIAQAGGKLRKDLVIAYDSWARTNEANFFVMYGQAEASPRIAYVPPSMLADNPDCIGCPIPGGQLCLMDTEEQEITQAGIEGELIYRGPNVMMGYAENALDLSKGKEIDVLRTGDIGVLTETNLFKVTARKKRICKIYGKRYNLDKIEQVLRTIDSSAVCLSNDTILFIASENKVSEKLVSLASSKFNFPHSNISTLYYNKIPVLASGKTDYSTIVKDSQEKICEKERVDKGSATEALLEAYQSDFIENKVTKNDSFVSLGGDSLTYVAISVNIERIIGSLPEKWEKKTIGELATVASTKSNSLFSTIEMGVFLRAISIVAIVFQHLIHTPVGGATILLFVSGYNFSRFHLDNFLEGNFKPTLFNLIKNILLPYWAILLFYNFLSRQGVNFQINFNFFTDCFLIGNYFHYSFYPFPTWFIQVLSQVIAFLSLILLIPAIRKYAKRNTQLFIMTLVMAAIIYRLVDSIWLMEMFPTKGADQRTAWGAWIFLFGLLVNRFPSSSGKKITTIALILLTVFFWYGDLSRVAVLSSGGCLLIWRKNISIPNAVVKPIQLLSSASLYIYISHLKGIVPYLIMFGGIVQAVVGIVQGLVFWVLYGWFKKNVLKGVLLGRKKKSRDVLL